MLKKTALFSRDGFPNAAVCVCFVCQVYFDSRDLSTWSQVHLVFFFVFHSSLVFHVSHDSHVFFEGPKGPDVMMLYYQCSWSHEIDEFMKVIEIMKAKKRHDTHECQEIKKIIKVRKARGSAGKRRSWDRSVTFNDRSIPHICHFFYTGRISENQILHPKKRLKAPKTL